MERVSTLAQAEKEAQHFTQVNNLLTRYARARVAVFTYSERGCSNGTESPQADPQGEIRTEDAYELYKAWCARNGQFAESMANFKSEMENFGTIKRKRPAGSGSTAQPKTFILGYKQLRFA